MYYVYVTSGPSLLIESIDSMIKQVYNTTIPNSIYNIHKFPKPYHVCLSIKCFCFKRQLVYNNF